MVYNPAQDKHVLICLENQFSFDIVPELVKPDPTLPSGLLDRLEATVGCAVACGKSQIELMIDYPEMVIFCGADLTVCAIRNLVYNNPLTQHGEDKCPKRTLVALVSTETLASGLLTDYGHGKLASVFFGLEYFTTEKYRQFFC